MTIPASYPKPEDYIKRYVKRIDSLFQYEPERRTAANILDSERLIVILGVAGMGKSIELENLAYEYSKANSQLIPVLVTLNNVTNENLEDIIRSVFTQFDQFPKDEILILFDALDEVHTNYIDVVSKKINLLVQNNPTLKVVVSCRNNFYSTEIEKSKAKLDLFKSYVLTPIDWFDIQTYIRLKVVENVEHLFEELEHRKLFDLLSAPFYLVKIIAYYNEHLTLPKSKKEVFEFLIQERIDKDLIKYKTSGINIDEYALSVNEVLEKIAMIMLYMGQNHLETEKVFGKVITDDKLRQIVKHTFLFNKTNQDESWQFEHNNFKEFLAARFLSKLTIRQVQKIVSTQGSTKRVKPNWLNAVSILFSVLPSGKKIDELTNWLLRIEPDALIRFEKDKLPLDIREKLFFLYHKDYSLKGVVIRSEKFEPQDLALMVSDSNEVPSYLVRLVDSSDDRITLINSLELFKYFDNVDSKITEVLFKKIARKDITNELKYIVFETFNELNIYSDLLTLKILDKISLELDEQYVRTGFYHYLDSANSDGIEPYLNLLLEGILRLRKLEVFVNRNDDDSDSDPHLSSEETLLKSLFNKLDSLESAKIILSWAMIQDRDLDSDPFFQIIGDTIHRCEKFTKSQKDDLINIMVNLTLHFCRLFQENLDKDLSSFFNSIDDPSTHIDLILSASLEKDAVKYNQDAACAIIASNKRSVNYILEQIREGVISDEKIFRLRNVLSMKKKHCMFQEFYDAIIQMDAKYQYQPPIDSDKLSKQRLERDRELIESRAEFIREVVNTFSSEESSEISNDTLWALRRNRFSDDEMTNNVVVDLLREFAEDDFNKMAKQSEIIDFLNSDLKWKGFRFNKLLYWDQQISEFEFTLNEKKLMIEWLEEHHSGCNFKTSLKQDGKRYEYGRLEAIALYLIIRLDFKIAEEVYLDILHFEGVSAVPNKTLNSPKKDDENGVVLWVISKTNIEKVKNRICENIFKRCVVDRILENHYKFCAKHKMEEIKDQIFNDITGDNAFECFDKIRFVDYFLGCNGSLTDFLPIMQNLDFHINLHILDKMSDLNDDRITQVCQSLIKLEDDIDVRLNYINILIKSDESLGFEYQMTWIIENEKYPEYWYKYKSCPTDNLSKLLFLYQKSLIKGFGKTSWRGHGRNDCLNGIIDIGSRSKSAYNLSMKYLNSWLEFAPEEKFLHYQIQKLEQEFYSKKTIALNFDEALDRVSNPLRISFLKYDYYRDRAKIEVLGMKINVIAILITIVAALITVVFALKS